MKRISGHFIKDRAITDTHIETNSIGTSKISDSTLIPENISSGTVTSDNIANGAVSTDRLAPSSVHPISIGSGVVSGSIIEDGSVHTEHLDNIVGNQTTVSEDLLQSLIGEYTYHLPVASGEVITANDLVTLINGEIAKADQPVTSTLTTHTSLLYESMGTYYTSICALSPTRAVVTYRDLTNTHGDSCLLSVTDQTITKSSTVAVTFETGATYYTSVCALAPDKVLVVYQDYGNSGYATACVLTISGVTITPGTPTVFNSANTYYTFVCPLTPDKALAVYSNWGDSQKGTACILSIDNTTITPGTPVVFETGQTEPFSVCTLTPDKALVTYKDITNSSYGTSCILSVSDTTITCGDPVVFESAATAYGSVCALLPNKALVTYQDTGNSKYGTACILTIVDTTITPGSPAVFESSECKYIAVSALAQNKAIVMYSDVGSSSILTGCVLLVSDTTITPSTPVVAGAGAGFVGSHIATCSLSADTVLVACINSSEDGIALIVSASYMLTSSTPVIFEVGGTATTSVCVLTSDKALVAYEDPANAEYGTARVLSISGTTVTPEAAAIFENAAIDRVTACTLSEDKVLVTYTDKGNSNYGTACILSISGTVITPGTPAVFNSGITTGASVCSLTQDTALVAYATAMGAGTACILSIDGTTITPYGGTGFESGSSSYICARRLSSDKVIVVYTDAGNGNKGTACILTISGTTITPGTPVVFNNALTKYTAVSTLTSDKAVAVCTNEGDSYRGTTCVLSVSDTVITPGTPALFDLENTNAGSQVDVSVCTLSSNTALVVYQNDSNHGKGKARILSVSNTTIIPGTTVLFDQTGDVCSVSVLPLSSNKAIVTYTTSDGKVCILSMSDAPSYFGIAKESKNEYESCLVADLTRSRRIYDLSGLTIGARYYSGCDGLITEIPSTPVYLQSQLSGSFLVGIAEDVTTLKIIGLPICE